MRGRKPRTLAIHPAEISTLREIARGRRRPAYQMQRALILLDIAAGERVRIVAEILKCDPATIWRTCRNFETDGIDSVLSLPPSRGEKGGAQPPP